MAKKMSGGKSGKGSGTGRTAKSFEQKLNTGAGIAGSGISSTLEKAAKNPYKGYTPAEGGDPLVGTGGSSGGSGQTYSGKD